MIRHALILLIVILGAWIASPTGQGVPPAAAQEMAAPDGSVRPLDRILPGIRSGRPGRFYDAEGPFPDAQGGYHYRIKWLTPQGRVIWLDADARSGRVLGVARGDWREMGPPPVPAFAPRPYPLRPGPIRPGRFGRPPRPRW